MTGATGVPTGSPSGAVDRAWLTGLNKAWGRTPGLWQALLLALVRGLPLLLLVSRGAFAQDDRPPPAALLALVPAGWEVLAWQRADLNADGRPDLVYVLQPQRAAGAPASAGIRPDVDDRLAVDERPRPLVVALAAADGRLRVAARNDRVVRCRACGGVWPEPFEALTAWRGGFALAHYGGSGLRWSERWRFDHDARAGTWFVSAWVDGWDTPGREQHLHRTLVRGRHFGSVRFEQLDPEVFHTRQRWRHVPLPKPWRDGSHE